MRKCILVGGPSHGTISEMRNLETTTPIRVLRPIKMSSNLPISPHGEIEDDKYYPRRVGLFGRILWVAIHQDLNDEPTIDALILSLILSRDAINLLEK